MKKLVLIGLIFLLSNSCKKDKDLGLLYSSLTGKWVAVNGTEEDFIELTKTGRFIYSKGLERQIDIRVDKLFDYSEVDINGVMWKLAFFNATSSKIFIVYNETRDTISTYTKQSVDQSGLVNLTLDNNFFYDYEDPLFYFGSYLINDFFCSKE